MDDSDHELIRRFRAGEGDAFEGLVRRWETTVLNLAYRITGHVEDAKDIRQRAFIHAFRGLPTFDGRARFSTWLQRIVINLCRDELRSRMSRNNVMETAPDKPSPSPTSSGDPAEREEAGRIVAKAVRSLPPDEREVVVLRHYQGLRFSEIADMLEAPVATIRSRMLRGLKRLHDDLTRAGIWTNE